MEYFTGGSELRHCVVVLQEVRELTLCVQGRQRGQRLFQLTDLLLMALDEETETETES